MLRVAKTVPTNLAPFLRHSNLSVGSDPEMFVFAGEKLLPAFAFLPEKGGNTTVYWDGFQAEWKYSSGIWCLDGFCFETHSRMRHLREQARKLNPKAKLSIVNTVSIPEEYFKKALPEHIALGCMPSFNANGIRGNVVNEPMDLMERFAGGHIHFGGFTKEPDHEKHVRILDAILGIWSVGAAEGIDTPRRRMYYGLAGEYRKPQYHKAKKSSPDSLYPSYDKDEFGIEYRTLSNFWLCAPQITNVTLEIGRTVAKFGSNDTEFKLWAAQPEETIHAIQTCDVKLARTILKRNENLFKHIWKGSLFSSSTTLRGTRLQKSADIAFNIGMHGVASIIRDPMDVEGNWGLARNNYFYEEGRFRAVADPKLLKAEQKRRAKIGGPY